MYSEEKKLGRDGELVIGDKNFGSLRRIVTMAGWSESTDAIRLASAIEHLWKLEDLIVEGLEEKKTIRELLKEKVSSVDDDLYLIGAVLTTEEALKKVEIEIATLETVLKTWKEL